MSLLSAILNLLSGLVVPVMAWLGGRAQAKNERLQDENAAKEKKAETLAAAHRRTDRVDALPPDDAERLRIDLNNRP